MKRDFRKILCVAFTCFFLGGGARFVPEVALCRKIFWPFSPVLETPNVRPLPEYIRSQILNLHMNYIVKKQLKKMPRIVASSCIKFISFSDIGISTLVLFIHFALKSFTNQHRILYDLVNSRIYPNYRICALSCQYVLLLWTIMTT